MHGCVVKRKLMSYSPNLVVFNIDMSDLAGHEGHKEAEVRNSEGEIEGVMPEHTFVLTPRRALKLSDGLSVFVPRWLIRSSSA